MEGSNNKTVPESHTFLGTHTIATAGNTANPNITAAKCIIPPNFWFKKISPKF